MLPPPSILLSGLPHNQGSQGKDISHYVYIWQPALWALQHCKAHEQGAVAGAEIRE